MALEVVSTRANSVTNRVCRIDKYGAFYFPSAVLSEIDIKSPRIYGTFLFDRENREGVLRLSELETDNSKLIIVRKQVFTINSSSFLNVCGLKLKNSVLVKFNIVQNEIHFNIDTMVNATQDIVKSKKSD